MIHAFALRERLTATDLDPVCPPERHPQMPLTDADPLHAYESSSPREASVLEDLAARTVERGPWMAAQMVFNLINEENEHVD